VLHAFSWYGAKHLSQILKIDSSKVDNQPNQMACQKKNMTIGLLKKHNPRDNITPTGEAQSDSMKAQR